MTPRGTDWSLAALVALLADELTADELDRGDVLRATLDCTGGFYAERERQGGAASNGSSG